MNTEKVKSHISNWILDYVTTHNIKRLVVGVSGGIDSAVVSTLCAETGVETILVEMPIRTNKNYMGEPISSKHVRSLMDRYDNVVSEFVDLTDLFNEFKMTIESQTTQKSTDRYKLMLANTASRLRMTTLYSFANTYQGIVVGTGNKVEDFGVGFFTVGGDGQVDISPIADLMKSEVYQLGEELGVIQEILDSRPTDGLWDDGRTDEDQIGATYDELEWAMKFVENNWYWEHGMEHEGFLNYDINKNKALTDDQQIILTDRQKEVLTIYLDRHNTNKFKMVSVPICKLDGIK